MFDGILQLPWWGYVIAALSLTHVTIAAVTLYLHRSQAHMAVEFHPVISHFFRFWLWLTTGMVTKEWVAVHRKHHAKVETAEDPHSPRVYGIHKVLWLGAMLYRDEASRDETIEKYGAGAPSDWIERNLYKRLPSLGISTMLAIDLAVFGLLPGGLIWLVQMAWIPFWAAGVINGIGHYWGYRNFEVPDASKNIVPWGIVIGGEELHNNHHAYASSARFSTKPWEFDVGWLYIRVLSALKLAEIKKTAPTLIVRPEKRQFDLDTVRAVLNNRFMVLAHFIRDVQYRVWAEEISKLGRHHPARSLLRRAKRLMAREFSLLNDASRRQLFRALDLNPTLQNVYAMKQRLQAIWSRSTTNQETLLQALEEWCRAAEASGIDALREFSNRLRRYEMAPS